MNYLPFPILTLLVSVQLGCASIQDVQYKSTHCIKAHAASAFAPRCPHFNDDYKCGFSQGYYDYSLNRKCKPPTIPPKEYWKAKYESPRGQQQIEAWYQGYEMGMLAAEQDCGNCWHRLHPRGLIAAETTAYPMNATTPFNDTLDAPHQSNSKRRIHPEPIPVPVPVQVPQDDDTGLFSAPDFEIQPAAYEEQAPTSYKNNPSNEPALQGPPTRDRASKPTLFAPPPLPR